MGKTSRICEKAKEVKKITEKHDASTKEENLEGESKIEKESLETNSEKYR